MHDEIEWQPLSLPMQRWQKLQFPEWPLEVNEISISPYIKMFDELVLLQAACWSTKASFIPPQIHQWAAKAGLLTWRQPEAPRSSFETALRKLVGDLTDNSFYCPLNPQQDQQLENGQIHGQNDWFSTATDQQCTHFTKEHSIHRQKLRKPETPLENKCELTCNYACLNRSSDVPITNAHTVIPQLQP